MNNPVEEYTRVVGNVTEALSAVANATGPNPSCIQVEIAASETTGGATYYKADIGRFRVKWKVDPVSHGKRWVALEEIHALLSTPYVVFRRGFTLNSSTYVSGPWWQSIVIDLIPALQALGSLKIASAAEKAKAEQDAQALVNLQASIEWRSING